MENRGWPSAAAMIEHPIRIRTAKTGLMPCFTTLREITLLCSERNRQLGFKGYEQIIEAKLKPAMRQAAKTYPR
jgi:hypothetical protein